MLANGQAGPAVVRLETLQRLHRSKRAGLGQAVVLSVEERPLRAPSALHLPHCLAPVQAVAKGVQGTDLGQRVEFVLVQPYAPRKLANRPEVRPFGPVRNDLRSRLGPQFPDIRQPQAHASSAARPRRRQVDHGAAHVRRIDIDRQHAHAVPLSILDQDGRRVEAHRLAVEQGRQKLRRIVRLQVRTGIRQLGEASRVRLGKAVQGE